jgi:hypothetical protein
MVADNNEDRLTAESDDQGREANFMDVDRMVNEGLGGGTVNLQNGYIGDSTTDTMSEPDSALDSEEEEV